MDAYKAFNTELTLCYGQKLEKFTKTCLDQDTQETIHVPFDYVLSFKRVILIFLKPCLVRLLVLSAKNQGVQKVPQEIFFIQNVHSEPIFLALPHIGPLKTLKAPTRKPLSFRLDYKGSSWEFTWRCGQCKHLYFQQYSVC